MSNVYFISDLHLKHVNALKWAGPYRPGPDIFYHDMVLIDNIKKLSKNDVLYILGDIVLGSGGLEDLLRLNEAPCRKMLVRGNHDDRFTTKELLMVFEEVYGIVKYKKAWLSHAPIHPSELRGNINIHGHVHMNSVRDHYHQYDERYVNVCVEALGGKPISYQKIIDGTYNKIRRC